MANEEMIRWIRATMSRMTGRRYAIDLETLPTESLLDLQRFLRDIEGEQQMQVKRARMQPWRRG